MYGTGTFHLRRITQTTGPLADEEKVDSLGLYEERSSLIRGGRDETRSVVQVQLTGTRDVEMARWLVLAGVKGKRIEIETRISRSGDVRATELVWNVSVEELRRELREEIDGVGLKLKLGDMRAFLLEVKNTRVTTNGARSERGVRDSRETMPVFHVWRNRGILRVQIIDNGVLATVDRRLETEHKGFNWPLELDEMDTVAALVEVLSLTTVDTNKGERYTVNEDIMDLWENEHVVNVKIKSGDLWDRERRVGKSLGRGRADDGVVKVLSLRKAEGDETLTVWNRDRRERKTSIGVEPEEKRDPKVEVFVSGLERLVTIKYIGFNMSRNWSTSGRRHVKTGTTLTWELLTHATLPSDHLVFRDVELTVENVGLTGVRVNRVRVDFESNFVEETLTREVTVTVEDNIGGRVSGRAVRERSSWGADNYVGNHISEEVAVLWDRNRDLRAERNVVGRNLEVLERNRDIWLMMSVDEKNVRTFNIGKRRVNIGFTGSLTTGLYGGDVFAKERVGKKELVHTTIVASDNDGRMDRPLCFPDVNFQFI